MRSYSARHCFATIWDVREDVNSEFVVYMRGDVAGSRGSGSDSMSHYLHVYYEDVEELYRKRVFRPGL